MDPQESKFKVGDRVTRTGVSWLSVVTGKTYEVSGLGAMNSIYLAGQSPAGFDASQFDLAAPWVTAETVDPLNMQISGDHYKSLPIQPLEYIHANKLTYAEGNVVKYISRHRTKNGAEDVLKALHYCQLILKLEYSLDPS